MLLVEYAILFCCALWSIWKQINNKVWNEVIDAQTYVVDRAKSMLQEWLVACLMCRTSVFRPKQVGNAKWTKSSTGIFKCNIEASFLKQTSRVGIRVCIIDATITFVLEKNWML